MLVERKTNNNGTTGINSIDPRAEAEAARKAREARERAQLESEEYLAARARIRELQQRIASQS
jgi:hypothetical protein